MRGISMPFKYNKNLKSSSRKLRNRMTDAEMLLWSKIKRKQLRGIQFYRQKPIGNYIADFYSFKAKLVIEIDGSQHYEKENKEKDKIRDDYFKKLGLNVLRFNNLEVLKNIDGVIEKICEEVNPTQKSP